jgi:RNA polymerase sigma factor (sigma-70 family)
VQSTEERIEPASARARGPNDDNGAGLGVDDPTPRTTDRNPAPLVRGSAAGKDGAALGGENGSGTANGSTIRNGSGIGNGASRPVRGSGSVSGGGSDGDVTGAAASSGRRRTPPPLGVLVDNARAGCAVSFERIYRQLAGQVASYLRWHRASDPDGLTNDVFVQVHRNLAKFEGDDSSFRSWLFTIAHHRMIDDRRRASRQPQVNGEPPVDEGVGCGDVEEDAFAVLAHDEVQSLVAVLSPDQRDVVLLRIVADLSVEQVAGLLGKREGAVKALQHRALAALRRHLDKRAMRT